MRTLNLFIISLSFGSMCFSTAYAESGVVDFGSKKPTETEFINALTPPGESEDIIVEGGRVRRIRSIKKVSHQPEKVAVNLSLTFEFDSAELTEHSKSVLDNLGGAIKKGLGEYTFRIEGYTDAVGEAHYNQSLSEKRAQSVKNYLVSNYGIDSVKLETVGKGENELFNAKEPGAAENRRVEIVNVGVLQ